MNIQEKVHRVPECPRLSDPQWIRDSALQGGPPCEKLHVLVPQLLQGVQYVHSRSIVHGDLKPGNMVVSQHGVLRLVDFGSAWVDLPGHRRVIRSHEGTERSALLCGTTPYKAIELVLGAADFGKPADIWAVGCVGFEMLVCKGLFRSSITSSELVPECFAQLGQHDNIHALSALPRWLPRYAQTPQCAADYWVRVGTVDAVGTGVAQCLFHLFNFDPSKRPTARGCLDLWMDLAGAPTTD